MLSKSHTARIRLASALLGAAMVLTVLVLPASAKGPESVTIAGPGLDQPLELMGGDNFDRVAKLMEQTGLWYGTGDLPRAIEQPTGDLGEAYTLTWINSGPPGDSLEKRTMVQYLYLDAKDGPFIHTPAQKSLEGWGAGVIGWFAAPAGLTDTLAALDVPLRAAASPFVVLGIAGFAFAAVLAGALGLRRSGR